MTDTVWLTIVHVLISLAGIGSGFVVAYGLATNRRLEFWTAAFFISTWATSLTGFLFPITRLTPGLVLGIASIGLLTVATAAKYAYQFQGWWQPAYVISAVTAFYLNFFVLIVQSFQKIPALQALAPTQTEWPFAAAHLAALAAFGWLGVAALRTFQVKPRWAERSAPPALETALAPKSLTESTVLRSLFPNDASLQRWRSN